MSQIHIYKLVDFCVGWGVYIMWRVWGLIMWMVGGLHYVEGKQQQIFYEKQKIDKNTSEPF